MTWKGGGKTHVACQLPVVQVALEDDEFAGLEVLVELRVERRQAPVASGPGPRLAGAEDEASPPEVAGT